MPVIIVGNEKNFTELRSRLFTGRVSSAKLQEVTDGGRGGEPARRPQGAQARDGPDDPGLAAPVGQRRHLARRLDEGADRRRRKRRLRRARRPRHDRARGRPERGRRAQAADGDARASPSSAAAAKRDKALGDDLKAVQKAVEDDEAAVEESRHGPAGGDGVVEARARVAEGAPRLSRRCLTLGAMPDGYPPARPERFGRSGHGQ